MLINVIYAHPEKKTCLSQEVEEGSLVRDVIERSGLLQRFSDIDLTTSKIGVFGKAVKMEQVVKPGDRIEIYVPIIADPKKVKKRKKAKSATQDDN